MSYLFLSNLGWSDQSFVTLHWIQIRAFVNLYTLVEDIKISIVVIGQANEAIVSSEALIVEEKHKRRARAKRG